MLESITQRTARRWSASFTGKSASRKCNRIFWQASSVVKPGGEVSDGRQTEQAPTVNPAMGIGRWIAGYNTTRPHLALGYRTLDEVYISLPVAGLAPTPNGVAA
ncbi:MAG TPA: hypothetical protein VD863_03320 [Bradyrhizobium sp.]|jgi:hypothetical protein|nr:hypothetical protein [Bradyrhizobium sp.]